MKLTNELYPCPVDGCDWALKHEDMPSSVGWIPTFEDGATLATINEAINAGVRRNSEAIDGKLRAHFESHDVLDWVRTVQRLNQDLYQQHGGIRPHIYRDEQTRTWLAGHGWTP